VSQNKTPDSISFPRLSDTSKIRREDEVPAVWNVGDCILDLYEVREVFWPGSKGLVYRVHHREWNVDLAVKSPRETPFETAAETENFVQAAADWFRLGLFPHIVSCYYVRTLGGIPRLFMEFVGGGTLQDWIHTRRLYEGDQRESLERVLDIAIQFAWGLQYAHEQGMVHGSIKPAKVLLTTDGMTKVTGFGLARDLNVDNFDAVSSAFRAPEDAVRQTLTYQTDIWSWAATVLEMFTGEVRWREGELSDAALQSYLEQGAARNDIPKMPPAVAAVLGECLHSDPAERPANMSQVAAALTEIYLRATGSPYPRPLPRKADTEAGALNNRALSLLDLGKTKDAIELWDQALIEQPQHAEATYNRGLVLWRGGVITDEELVKMIEALKPSAINQRLVNHLLGLIHLERDDGESANEVLRELDDGEANRRVELNRTEIEATPGLARSADFQPARPLSHFCGDDILGPNRFSPDGKSLLLTVAGDRIRILDFTARRAARYLEGHTDTISGLTISANGKYALSSSVDGTLRLWEIGTAKCLQTSTWGEWPYTCPSELGLSDDGRYAVVGRRHGVENDVPLNLWDVRAGHRIREFEVVAATETSEWLAPVQEACISPDARYALTGRDFGPLEIWDAGTGKCLKILEGLFGPYRFVQFSADVTQCIVATTTEVAIFDVSSGECLQSTRIDDGEHSPATYVSISAEGKYALVGGWMGGLRLWELATGRCLRTFREEDRQHIREERFISVELSREGRYALSEREDQRFQLWQFKPGYHAPMAVSRVKATKEALDNQRVVEENLIMARQAIAAERFSEAANFVRAARAVPGFERSAEALELWASLYAHLPRRGIKASWPGHEVKAPGFLRSITLSADGKYVLFGGRQMELREVATGKLLRAFDNGDGKIALSGDMRLALVGGWENYELWNIVSGELITKIYSCHERHITDICLSGDGRYAVSCTDEVLNFWEITPEHGLRYLLATKTDWGELSAVAISSNNKYCVTGTGFSAAWGANDYHLRLWELPSCKCIRTFEGQRGTYAVAFTPDNKQVLAAGYKGELRLLDIANGECVRLFEGHTDSIYVIDISPDGKYAVSAGCDYAIKLWDMPTGTCLFTFKIDAEAVSNVRLSRDYKYILWSGRSADVPALRLEFLDWELSSPPALDGVSQGG